MMKNILISWLSAGPIEQQLISFNHHSILTGERFTQHVANLHQALENSPYDRWLLSNNNSELFAIGLCAALIAGKKIILPANVQPATLLTLQAEYDAILSDDSLSTSTPSLNLSKKTSQTELVWPEAKQWGELVLFTSGSSGKPKAIKKTLEQLNAEVSTLEATFARQLSQCTIIATVSHQHIYGLLFKILWPLASRRPFLSELIEYPETLSYYSTLFPQLCLVSSPAHLSRLPASLDFKKQQQAPNVIFSSGGPLTYDAAKAIKQCYATLPIEVFGSTETGGIAYRQQQSCQQSWKAFNPILIKQDERDGALWLKSPYVQQNDWIKCDDKIQLTAKNAFHLQGRLDKIVKIEEKRLSLIEMENLLQTHPMVQAAALLILEGDKIQLAAVIELSDTGNSYLNSKGKLSLNNVLKSYLLTQFERITLPKRWRYPHQLPVNTQGKRIHSQLLALFSND